METSELSHLNQVKSETVENDNKPERVYTFSEKFKMVATNITVEPIMLCYDIPHVVASLAMQHLNLEKACRVDLNYTTSICDAMAVHNETGYAKEDEAIVQKYVASAMAYRSILQSVIPTILVLFLGSWSDRHQKRKPCIILPLFGEVVLVLGLAISTYFFYEMPIIYNVFIEGLPPALTGGAHSLDMAVFAYISSITTLEERTVRVGAVNLIITVAGTIGSAICGVLYYQLGFYGCYVLTISAYTFGIFYTMIRIKDTKIEEDINAEPKKSFLVDFFNPEIVKDTFQVAFKEGERNRRKRILAIMILVVVIIGPMIGEHNVLYMFTRYRYEWDEIDYSIYNTFYAVVHIAGGIFSLMLFSKYLKFDDAMLGMLSSTSKILASLVFAFAPSPTVFYIGAIVELFNGTSFIAMRTIISKLVPANELGKIYSIFSVCEAITPLIYGPMYTSIYKLTIDVVPGAFFLAGGLLTIPSVLIFYWLHLENQHDIKTGAIPKTEDSKKVNTTELTPIANEKSN